MNSEIKIPTLLALAILLTGIVVGVYSVSQTKTLFSKASASALPKNIQISNLDSSSVSISFETDTPVTGFISAGTTSSLGQVFLDERDSGSPIPHSLHFITLTGLTPNTTYYYKISTGSDTYPDQPLSFKTTLPISPPGYKPLIGTITDTNMQPTKEAFVQLQIPGAETLMTITKQNGSFILPLATLKNDRLDKPFSLKIPAESKLLVFDATTNSEVTLTLPYTGEVLPKITLGINLNLITPSPSISPVLGAATQAFTKQDLDLNHDQRVDLKDLSFLLKLVGTTNSPKQADLNHDGKVDRSDVEIFQQTLHQLSSSDN